MAKDNKNLLIGLGALGGVGLIYWFFFREEKGEAAPRMTYAPSPAPSSYTQPKSTGGGGGDPKVLAFQKQWNKDHPNDKLTEDGKLGPETKKRMAMAQSGGGAPGTPQQMDPAFMPYCDEGKPGACKPRSLWEQWTS